MAVKNSDDWFEAHQSEALSEKIKIRRKSFNWSQEELGFRAGIARQTVSRIERNVFKPSFDTLMELERVLRSCLHNVEKPEADGNLTNFQNSMFP